jgi:arabinofuranosyltransferase
MPRPRQEYLVATSVVFIALVVRVAANTGVSDDAFIALRVARNIATGQGLGFNPSSHLQSNTSPLWAAISAAVWKGIGERTEVVLPILGIVADAVAAGGIVLLACLVLPSLHAALPGLFYATLSTTALIPSLGLETGLYVLVIVGAFLALSEKRHTLASILAALAFLVRPDGALLIGVFLGCRYVQERRPPFKEAAIVTAIILPYVVFALGYYGTVIPQSVTAKSMVARSASEQWWLVGGKLFLGSPKAVVAGGLFTVGCVWLIRHHHLRPLMLWGAVYVAAFSTFTMWWPWYFPPAMIAFVIGLGAGVWVVIKAVSRSGPPRVALSAAATLILCGGALLQTASIVKSSLPAAAMLEQRKTIGAWIDAHTPPEATVMLEPVGMVGFFSTRRFHDYPGLVSREVTEALKELGGRVPGKPVDPAVMKHVLDKVKPSLLVLREDEHQALAGKALDGYAVVRVFEVDPRQTRVAPSFQRMVALERK